MRNLPTALHNKSAMLLALVCLALTLLAGAQAQTSSNKTIAPKTAPDRHLRPQQAQYAAPAPQQNSQPAAGDGPPHSAGTTSVSLTGGVTRLDGTASDQSGRQPLSGKIESMLDVPLQAQKPRSEQVPPATFRGWLENSHPEFALSTSRNSEDSVVVIKGQWDDSSKTLDKFQIPHAKISGRKLVEFPLHNTRVVIIDCAGDLPREACQKLRDFVSRGGYVLSTDWALDNFTSPTFNEYIQWNRGVNRHDMVDATAFDTDPVLFDHTVNNAYWKLDQESHLIRIMNRDAVRILVKSKKLIEDDPDRAGILAVVFPFGRGFVMHMTGHFDNNSKLAIGNFLPDPAPGIKISLRQALAANFVVAGLTKTRIATHHRR